MRTLKLILTENNGEVNECNVPIIHTAQKEITDAELEQYFYGRPFELMTEVKKLSDRLDKHIEANHRISKACKVGEDVSEAD